MNISVMLSIFIALTFGEALRLHPDGPEESVSALSDAMAYAEMVSAEKLALAATSAYPLQLKLPSLKNGNFNVRFYVYDELDLMATKCHSTSKYKKGRVINISDAIKDEMPAKHTDDFFFLKAALNHPLRVSDPAKAELFVVPALFNTVSDVTRRGGSHLQCCVGDICNYDFFGNTDRMLEKSTWFKRKGGKDHVVVCSHYHCAKHMNKFQHIKMCNSVSFEENSLREGRCRIAKTYVGSRCDPMPKKFMFGMIASLRQGNQKNFGKLQTRRDICEWVTHAAKTDHAFTVSICGAGKQCPALAQSQFGFHARGDTWGSNRLMDTILSGTVPIFTNSIQYEILPPYLPWKNISILIDVSNEEEFKSSLRANVPRYETLKSELDKYASLVDWETPAPFEQYMSLFRQCV